MFVYLYFLWKGSGELSSPLNIAVRNGETVRLNCSTRKYDTEYWFRTAPMTSDEILLYHKKSIKNDMFTIEETEQERSDLLFTAAKRTSGRYGCYSVEATRTAEVILTGKYLCIQLCVVQ